MCACSPEGQLYPGLHQEKVGQQVEGSDSAPLLAQRGSGDPIPGNIQNQVGRGSEQPGLVKDVPAHYRGVGLDDSQRSLPTQSIL